MSFILGTLAWCWRISLFKKVTGFRGGQVICKIYGGQCDFTIIPYPALSLLPLVISLPDPIPLFLVHSEFPRIVALQLMRPPPQQYQAV